MKRLPAIVVCIAAVLMVAGCIKVPRGVLSQEPMARLMADLELANAMSNEIRRESAEQDSLERMALRRSVLGRHGVSEATLDSSLRWYGRNLPELLKVYDRVDSILADSLRAIDREDRLALAAAAGDTVNLWPLQPSMAMQGSQFLTFELPTDSSWHRADVVQWNLVIHNNRKLPVRMVLAADYANKGGTTEAQSTERLMRDGNALSLTLQLDRQKSVSRVYGWLYVPLDSGQRIFADSITLVRTRLVDDEYQIRRYRMRRLDRRKGL